MEYTNNPLYILIKALGLNLSEEYHNEVIPLLNELFGGIKVNLSISVSHQIDTNGNITVENTASGHINQSVGYDLFSSEELTVSAGGYTDSERLAIGTYTSAQANEWELSLKNQVGVYSMACIWEASYIPDNILLPSVTVALDAEIHHLVTVGVVAAAVAAPYVAPALASAFSGVSSAAVAAATSFITTAVDFMSQLSQKVTC